MSTPVTGYDLTVPAHACSVQELASWLNQWAKKWVFQKEKGEDTGYLHYQCRLHLFTKRRLGEIISVTQDFVPSKHWSVTSNKTHQGQSFSYVMKADTRVDGPFKDSDFEEPAPLTRQLKVFNNFDFHPWQNQVLQWVTQLDDRSIKLIYDQHGNAGKSIMAEYLEYHGLAFEIPPFRLMEDIMQCVMSVKPKKAYLIDMPRAMKKDRMADFYSGLEALKNGIAYDKRYSFKKRRMDRPQVLLFTNVLPDWRYMSLDRWECYTMAENKALAPIDVPGVSHPPVSPPSHA